MMGVSMSSLQMTSEVHIAAPVKSRKDAYGVSEQPADGTPQLEELEGCRWIDVSEYAAGQEKAFADRYQRVHESLNRAISTYQQGEYGGLVVDNLMPLPSSSSSVKADDPPRRLQLLLTSARNLNGKEDERSKL